MINCFCSSLNVVHIIASVTLVITLFVTPAVTQIVTPTTGDRKSSKYLELPLFSELVRHYPGYASHGGRFHNHRLIKHLGVRDTSVLLRDTSALRLSAALNGVGGPHSLGRRVVRLSTHGRDSVTSRGGKQLMYHPLALGPYLADKYGYPTLSRSHDTSWRDVEKTLSGRQGIVRIVTYTRVHSSPVGHVGLWACRGLWQARDWIKGHDLVTVEFWETPDSNCNNTQANPSSPPTVSLLEKLRPSSHQSPPSLNHGPPTIHQAPPSATQRMRKHFFKKNGRVYAQMIPVSSRTHQSINHALPVDANPSVRSSSNSNHPHKDRDLQHVLSQDRKLSLNSESRRRLPGKRRGHLNSGSNLAYDKSGNSR